MQNAHSSFKGKGQKISHVEIKRDGTQSISRMGFSVVTCNDKYNLNIWGKVHMGLLKSFMTFTLLLLEFEAVVMPEYLQV